MILMLKDGKTWLTEYRLTCLGSWCTIWILFYYW